jgi:aryl sulfotransferase
LYLARAGRTRIPPHSRSWRTHDLKKDFAGGISRIAEFLDIELTPERRDHIAEETTFESAKRNAAANTEKTGEGNSVWKRGSDGFFFKGTNGRWREVLDDADLAMYEATKKRVLAPDCATWLEEGGAL